MRVHLIEDDLNKLSAKYANKSTLVARGSDTQLDHSCVSAPNVDLWNPIRYDGNYYIWFNLCVHSLHVYCFIEDYVNNIEQSHTLQTSVWIKLIIIMRFIFTTYCVHIRVHILCTCFQINKLMGIESCCSSIVKRCKLQVDLLLTHQDESLPTEQSEVTMMQELISFERTMNCRSFSITL